MKLSLVTPLAVAGLTLLLFAPPASAGLFGSKSVSGSGDLVTESRDIPEFNRIRSSGSFDINVKIGPETSVSVTFDDNLIDLVSTEVKGRTLHLQSEGSFRSRKSCKVDITVPSLETVLISGSGDFFIDGLSGEEFVYEISGSGDATLIGTIDEVTIEVSGSGDVDARDLKAKRAYIEIAGSGDVAVWADELLDADIAGSGDIGYYGNPEKVSRHVAGSGNIRKK